MSCYSIIHSSANKRFFQKGSYAVGLPDIGKSHQQKENEESSEGAEIRIQQYCASQALECIQWQQAKGLFTQIETGIKVSEKEGESEKREKQYIYYTDYWEQQFI